ncbi:hypothetical protein [Lacinutrix sp. MEBiC02404]
MTYLGSYGLNRLEGWKESSLIIMTETKNLVIDCSSCHESLEFSYLYMKHENELLEKHKPTEDQYIKSKTGIEYSFISHLRIQDLYLDILLDNN